MIKKSWLISVALFQKDVLEQKTWLIPSEYLNYTKWKEQCRSCDPPCTTMHYLHKVSGTISDFCNVGQLFSSHPTHPCCVLQLSCLTSQLSSSFVQVTWNQSLACTEVFSSWKSELHIRINLFFLGWHSERHSGFPLSMARLNHVQIFSTGRGTPGDTQSQWGWRDFVQPSLPVGPKLLSLIVGCFRRGNHRHSPQTWLRTPGFAAIRKNSNP